MIISYNLVKPIINHHWYHHHDSCDYDDYCYDDIASSMLHLQTNGILSHLYIYIYIHTYDNYTQILSRTCILDCCTSGKVFLGPPGHLNIPSPIYRTIHLNIRMELMFHTTSGALWSGPPSTYLNVFKCRYSTHTHNIYIYMYKRRRNHNFG